MSYRHPEHQGDGYDSSTAKPLPSFVKKLWMLVNDASIDRLIRWTDPGTGIWIADAGDFSKTVLPRYFKHGNWQSFVRQLNLYGFRKVCDACAEQQHDGWQFRHSHFRRDAELLLQYVKRKRGGGGNCSNGQQFRTQFAPPYTVPAGVASSPEAITARSPVPSPSAMIPVEHTHGTLSSRLQRLEINLRDMEDRNAYVCTNLLAMRDIQAQQNEALHNLLAFVSSMHVAPGEQGTSLVSLIPVRRPSPWARTRLADPCLPVRREPEHNGNRSAGWMER